MFPLFANPYERLVDLQDTQLQEIVDKTIMEADKDGDGKLSFEEFTQMVANTVSRQNRLTLRNLCGRFWSLIIPP